MRNLWKLWAFLKRDFQSEISYRLAFLFQVARWTGLPPGPWEQISVKQLAQGGTEVEVALEDANAFEDLLQALLAADAGVRACDRIEPDLEEAFSRILAQEGTAAPVPQAVPR